MSNTSSIRAFLQMSFVKFLWVGAINVPLGLAIMFTLYNVVGLSYWLSSSISYGITGILSFILNKYITFKVKRWSLYIVIAFFINLSCCYTIAYYAAEKGIHFILKDYSLSIRDNVSLFTGGVLFIVLNYFGQRFFVYRGKSHDF
jgi:putative flippase GtrA